MNTRTTTISAVPSHAENVSALSTLVRVEFIAPLIVCGILAAGAFLAFPLYDDSWVALTLRESGPHFLAQHMGDRPVFGFLLEHLASFGSANKLVFVLLNAVIWLGFAWESAKLFGKLFPELKDYSVIAACLTLAPVVLQTQLSTASVVIPANLAAICGYGALLVLLRQPELDGPNRFLLFGIASILAAMGIALSEYGVATNLVASAILFALAITAASRAERWRLVISAGWLFTLTIITYVLFARVADFSTRPDVAPAHLLQRSAAKWMEIPFDVISGAWHAIIGFYGAALGSITLAWDTKSTLVGFAIGIVIAALLYMGIRNRPSERRAVDEPAQFEFRLAILVPVVLVGLLPFSVMGRPTTLLDFGSRFRIPIMPVAAAITVALALGLVRSSLRWIPVVAFGLIVGYSSWMFTYTAIEQSRAIASLSAVLKPKVAQTSGVVVAVVPFNRFESELTANISATWPVEMEKRLWVIAQEPAQIQFGGRNNCRPSATLDVQARGLTRAAKMDKLLWVETPAGQPVIVEPYCRDQNPAGN